MSNKIEEREKKLQEYIAENGAVKISSLAAKFAVSRETIRRDILSLEKKGKITKWYGTVMPKNDFNIPAIEKRMAVNQLQKKAICNKAIEYMPKSSVIFLDAGSTLLWLAKKLKNMTGYTILTSSISIVNELVGSKNRIIILGGVVDPATMSIMGAQTLEFLDEIKIDTAFLGTSGFAEHQGPTVNSFNDGQIKQKVIKNCQTSIVLADSSKAVYASLSQYSSWNDIDILITDRSLPKDSLTKLEKRVAVVISKA
ncbi:DeoR/GlpR family DNA-binding transcription regulator [Lactobacillus sp. ESL0791]|uniref:DeoR/GlpR family DNA-binding transcription regulator n=1 Tax=Lactobacillus sp. ESL0791 TaxID=2983234 RepID=UPI0023F92A91|nr:DeoR/GlpR family DNA-binding transcription regulator [Lactobacillus sp. ESL0791]MDF7638119.1 DeoR/GlpR family DNA-binding transcription regulator [Lactobacillus sp. ESL0791]